MEPFTCPQCGHRSQFDPWTGAARCPRCGFAPPAGGVRYDYVRWANRYAHQPYLDELSAHWNGTHRPDPHFTLDPPDDPLRFFQEYQRALGEDPRGAVGPQVQYVRAYHPNRQEILIFVEAYQRLQRGDRAGAAQDLGALTFASPQFVDPWLWLTATTDAPAQRLEYLVKATNADVAHPLARDALLLAQAQAAPGSGRGEQRMMTTECPQCGGALRYEPEAAEVVCAYCGSRLELHARLDYGEKSSLQGLRLERRYQGHRWEEARRILRCQECGADLTLSDHLAQRCTFCGSTNVLVEDGRRALQQPDGLVPFRVAEQQATEILLKMLQSGRQRLKALWADEGQPPEIEELRGVYLPFWVFEVTVEAGWWAESFVGLKKESSKIYTSDQMLFPAFDVPPPSLLRQEAIPFHLTGLLPYEPRLLADWPARLYSRDVEAVAEEAYELFLGQTRRTLSPAATTAGPHVSCQVLGATYQLLLLPVWVALIRDQGGYRLAIVNGQTGRAGIAPAMAGEGRRAADEEPDRGL